MSPCPCYVQTGSQRDSLGPLVEYFFMDFLFWYFTCNSFNAWDIGRHKATHFFHVFIYLL